MPDRVWGAVAGGGKLPPTEALVTRVVLATALGFVIAAAHRWAVARLAPAARLVAAETAKQGAMLELTYQFPLPDPAAAAALINELSRVEGVQGVELRD